MLTYPTKIRGVVQARFTSRRFPGKVLKEFRGKKILTHVLEAMGRACGKESVILATSDQVDDDSVAALASCGGWAVYRGSLEDVWSRFRDIAASCEAEWIIRICADSPLIPFSLIQNMIQLLRIDLDLVTNIYPRTFPRGQSVEIIHRRLFCEKAYFPRTREDREHVTPHLYRIPGLRILNYQNPWGDQSIEAWSVEEPGDIERLEKLCRD